jgi:surface polysaccharide O-acyltransferase-like enzyme
MNIFGASIWGASVWMIYLLIGYAFKQGFFERIPTWVSVIVFVISIAAFAILTNLNVHNGVGAITDYGNIFAVLGGTSFFALVRTVFDRIRIAPERRISRILAVLSGASFSVYMIHIWFVYSAPKWLSAILPGAGILQFLLLLFVSLAGSFIIGWGVLGRLKVLRKWLLLMKG